jgi:hypothetical protein
MPSLALLAPTPALLIPSLARVDSSTPRILQTAKCTLFTASSHVFLSALELGCLFWLLIVLALDLREASRKRANLQRSIAAFLEQRAGEVGLAFSVPLGILCGTTTTHDFWMTMMENDDYTQQHSITWSLIDRPLASLIGNENSVEKQVDDKSRKASLSRRIALARLEKSIQ